LPQKRVKDGAPMLGHPEGIEIRYRIRKALTAMPLGRLPAGSMVKREPMRMAPLEA
jgi:hypothetical protein